MIKLPPLLIKCFDKAVNFVYLLICLALAYLCCQLFLFATFRIPSDSMEPTFEAGDDVLVCKPLLGARLFNVFATLRLEQPTIHRMYGLSSVKRGDILVFNFPHPNKWDKIEMHILKYYVKRCVGLPGDTVSIVNSHYQVNGVTHALGYLPAQKQLARKDSSSLSAGIYNAYPFNKSLNWNIQHFGPLHIPKAGDEVVLTHHNYLLYHKAIAWEQAAKVTYKDSTVYINNIAHTHYRFKKNYYFTAGDKVENSQDSRYWGLLPEEYIVGKAWMIWRSKDINTDEIRWNRCLKWIE